MASSHKSKKDALTFEQSMERLDSIVKRIDSPDTALEEMISLVEEGLQLIRSSRETLKKAELRINMLENEAAPQASESSAAPDQRDNGFSLF